MDIAALIAWIVTAGGGFFLIGAWLAKGGIAQQRDRTTRFSAPLVFGHPLLAAAGLVVWIAFLVSDDNEALAWTAFGLLVPIALSGFALFARWLSDRRTLARSATGATATPAEQHQPAPVVLAHGALAVVTVVLVLLAAIDAGT